MSLLIGSSVLNVCYIRCDRSVQVDKEEYEASKVLICPVPDCNYAWCKACQKPVTTDHSDPPHSCDGAAELHHLVQQQGWKYCPSKCLPIGLFSGYLPSLTDCKIPVERNGGCLHMSVRDILRLETSP